MKICHSATAQIYRFSVLLPLHKRQANRDNENRHRATLLQLNRGEGCHSLARAIFHGKRGELRQHYREGQEDQLGALGLVVNIIVLWNTIYIDAALAQLRQEGLSGAG